MSKLLFWVCFVVGTIVYNVGKHLLGFEVQMGDAFAAIYWSGTSLLFWHFMDRTYSRLAAREKAGSE